ncbi:MAG: PglZ domain-containing protein [Chloroflexi bacterium]|nr:PglZ domain-containing protein [Chloroflexota bacterium]
MGLVTDKLFELIRTQVEAHRTVVWFDPEGAYLAAVSSMASLSGAPLFVYRKERGFVALRRDMETLWNAQSGESPRMVIYVPLAQADTHHALVEFALVGVVMQPGQQPPECNTRLAAVARVALEPLLPAAVVAKIVAEVEAGSLSLADLDTRAEQNAGDAGVLAIIFNSGNVQEISLRFLSEPELDETIRGRSAIKPLRELFANAFEIAIPIQSVLSAIRTLLARYLLTTEFLALLNGPAPERLSTVAHAHGKAARETAVQVVRAWRQRRDLGASYAQAAQRVEAELGLGDLAWEPHVLKESETFYRTETALQALVEAEVGSKGNGLLMELARGRADGFWSTQKPESKLRWQVIAQAGLVLETANRIARELKAQTLSADALYVRYTSGDAPWCELDRAYRHLERDYHRFDPEDGIHDRLVQLVTRAQQRYREVIDELANRFIHGYEAVHFDLPGGTHQTDIFRSFVATALAEDKMAYILVDALRFEMAREFAELLAVDFKADLSPALATPPTITPVGMAALMPGAERGLGLVALGGGKLGIEIGGTIVKNSQERLKHLQKQVGETVAVVELSQLAPLNSRQLRSKLAGARLIVVTASDEIDGLWENNPNLARQMQDDVFNQLRRGLRSLFGVGVRKAIITADHGYLFGPKLIEAETIDAPGGDTADLHRRVWVGNGGSAIPGCLRTPVAAFGLSGDLELVTPFGLAWFKVQGGSMVYSHGGLSLQEIVIPVLTVAAGELAPVTGAPAFSWTLVPGAAKITTRFFSVTIQAEAQVMLASAPRVRLELRAGDQVISVPVAAAYGFQAATGDVALATDPADPQRIMPNSVTLQVTEVPQVAQVALYLLDSDTGTKLASRADLPIEIAL